MAWLWQGGCGHPCSRHGKFGGFLFVWLVCLRGKHLLVCSWDGNSWEQSAGILSSPCPISPNPILQDTPRELQSTSLDVPASVPNPNILWDLLRSSCDPGKPKALRFPGISCFPQRMGRVGSDRNGDPRTCCHLPSQGVGAAIRLLENFQAEGKASFSLPSWR